MKLAVLGAAVTAAVLGLALLALNREARSNTRAVFMQQLAMAYQTRDVAFFRENATQFNDAMENAVRRSPSVRVELQVQKIDVRDPQHANVSVKRTDWFADASMPPQTQALIYHLDRSAGHWQIASFTLSGAR